MFDQLRHIIIIIITNSPSAPIPGQNCCFMHRKMWTTMQVHKNMTSLSLSLSFTHMHACTHTVITVMDRLFILRHICIHKAVSAHICVFTCCIWWPNENKSIVPLGRDCLGDVLPQQTVNILLHPASVVSQHTQTHAHTPSMLVVRLS